MDDTAHLDLHRLQLDSNRRASNLLKGNQEMMTAINDLLLSVVEVIGRIDPERAEKLNEQLADYSTAMGAVALLLAEDADG